MRFLIPLISIVLLTLLSLLLANSRISTPSVVYPPLITTPSLPEAKKDQPYTAQIEGRDSSSSDILKMIITNLPEGLRQEKCQSLVENNQATITCAISGIPFKAENSPVDITLTNSQTGLASTKTIFLPIGTPSISAFPLPVALPNTSPSFNLETLPPGFFLTLYNVAISATDHDVADHLTLSAKGLPYNLTLNNCTQTANPISQTEKLQCLISGRVLTPGIFRPVFTVSDNQNPPLSLTVTLFIFP